MGYTRREFLANLDAALKGRAWLCEGGDTVRIELEGGCVHIRLGAEQERRIASLAMPYIRVDFRFENLDAEQRTRFYTAFQRSFQKGGG